MSYVQITWKDVKFNNYLLIQLHWLLTIDDDNQKSKYIQ